MKRLTLLLPIVLVLSTACSSSGGAKPAPAAEKKAPADDLKAEEARKLVETAKVMAGIPPGKSGPAEEEEAREWTIVTDPATGQRLQRIPKDRTLRVVNGKVVSGILNAKIAALDLVREDANYYYVAAPQEPKPGADELTAQEELPNVPLMDPGEWEVAAPKVSAVRIRLEERSEGLPKSGYWRTNMAVADMDGDRNLEIVTPPPRLAAATVQIFRYDGTRWSLADSTFGGDETLAFAYGGVAVADIDGDGKADIVSVGHGSGPFLSFGEGAFRFRKEDRGLPREMSSRAVALGDIDGDGRLDVLALSDKSESNEAVRQQTREQILKKEHVAPKEGAYVPGLNARAFFSASDGTFVQNSAGLEPACWGYSLALDTRPVDGGAPFFASSCRSLGDTRLLWEFDRKGKSFRFVGKDVVESYSYHLGTATVTYRGKPGAVVSFVKMDGRGSQEKSMRGNGISVYYRDGNTWKRKRVVKTVGGPTVESQGLGVGDLNGDGLDDIVWADDAVGRVRVFFQTAKGEFEELDPALEPKFVNHSMSVKVADVDGDGRKDIVLMYEFKSTDKSRAGGLRFFRNAG